MFRDTGRAARDIRGSLGLVVWICIAGCSGGARRSPAQVTQTARNTVSSPATTTGANDVPASPDGRTKCNRRYRVTAEDGRDMVIYTDDKGSCDPVRPLAVTRLAAE